MDITKINLKGTELNIKDASALRPGNIKTVNHKSIVGSGDITVVEYGVLGDSGFVISVYDQTHGTWTGTGVAVPDATTLYVDVVNDKAYRYDGSAYVEITGSSGGGGSVVVVNNLDSNSTTSALSAKQGKELKGMVDDVKTEQLDIQLDAEFAQASYFYIVSNYNGDLAYVPQGIGDTFGQGRTNNGIDDRFDKESWVHSSLVVSAGDQIILWGKTRQIKKTAGYTSQFPQGMVSMPMYWVTDSNKVITAVSDTNLTYTSESPCVIDIEQDGYVFFHSAVVEIANGDAIDYGFYRLHSMSLPLVNSGVFLLNQMEDYDEEYCDESFYINGSINDASMRARATACREFLQLALDRCAVGGSTLIFPKDKVFTIDVERPLRVKANTTVDLNGCTIKCLPHDYNSSNMVQVLYGQENVTIKNGTLMGDKGIGHIKQAGTTETHEYNYGLYIAASNCTVKNVHTTHFMGDGINIFGETGWNNLIPLNRTDFTGNDGESDDYGRGYIDSSSGAYVQSASGGTYVTDFLELEDYLRDVIEKKRHEYMFCPRPTFRIPDLGFKFSYEYSCFYYSYSNSTYTYLGSETLRWGDFLNTPTGTTYIRLQISLDANLPWTASSDYNLSEELMGAYYNSSWTESTRPNYQYAFDNLFPSVTPDEWSALSNSEKQKYVTKKWSRQTFSLWVSIVHPLADVHIEGCEVSFCGRNGINPTSVRRCTIERCEIHDIGGTNNHVGIDFENNSYIDKDIIVRQCRLYRCGGKWFNIDAGGGAIIFAQGSHFIVDNCDIAGGVSGYSEDVHIINTRAERINLIPRGGVNFVEAPSSVIGCEVTNDINVPRGIISGCYMKNCCTDSAAKPGSDAFRNTHRTVVRDSVITGGIGIADYENCLFKGTFSSYSGVSYPLITFKGCTFNIVGNFNGLATVDFVNCDFHITPPTVSEPVFSRFIMRRFEGCRFDSTAPITKSLFGGNTTYQPSVYKYGCVFRDNVFDKSILSGTAKGFSLIVFKTGNAVKDIVFEGNVVECNLTTSGTSVDAPHNACMAFLSLSQSNIYGAKVVFKENTFIDFSGHGMPVDVKHSVNVDGNEVVVQGDILVVRDLTTNRIIGYDGSAATYNRKNNNSSSTGDDDANIVESVAQAGIGE